MSLSPKLIDAIVAHELRAQEHGRSSRHAGYLEHTRQRLILAIEDEVAAATPITLDSMSDAVEILQQLAGRKT